MDIEVMDMDMEIRDMEIEDKEKGIASITMTIEVRENGITDHLPDRKDNKYSIVFAVDESNHWQE